MYVDIFGVRIGLDAKKDEENVRFPKRAEPGAPEDGYPMPEPCEVLSASQDPCAVVPWKAICLAYPPVICYIAMENHQCLLGISEV